MLDAAIDLAGHGWAVFPCYGHGARAKAPRTAHGFHDASRDPDLIAEWWRRWPDALIGAPVPDTLLVLDIDPRHGGSREALEATLGPLPDTLTAWSGRGDGGGHLYYLRPGGRLTSTRLPEGVDLKHRGGYCILPPSLHPATGQPYRWEHRPVAVLPPRAQLALRPAVRLHVVASGRRLDRIDNLARVVLDAAEGNRNGALYWACRRAIDDGATSLADLQPLIDAAHSRGLTVTRRGMTEAEVTAESALRGARVVV